MRRYLSCLLAGISLMATCMAALVCSGCGGSSTQSTQGFSTVTITIGSHSSPPAGTPAKRVAAGVIPSAVKYIVFTVSGPGMAELLHPVAVPDNASTPLVATLSVPNGPNRTFRAAATDAAGNVLYQGQKDNVNLTGIAVDITLDMQSIATSVKGTVTDAAAGQGLDGVTLTFTPLEVSGTPVVATTANGGTYATALSDGTYSYTAGKEGYGTAAGSITIVASAAPRMLDIALTSNAVTVTGTVSDATTLIGLDGVTVTFTPQTGSVSPVTMTTSGGGAFTAALPAGSYSFATARSGYAPTSSSVTVIQSSAVQLPGIFMTPVSAEYWSATLSWGAVPRDLDQHLDVPGGSTWQDVYWDSKGSQTLFPFATLVMDNHTHSSTTSLGPETTLIFRDSSQAYQSGVYKLYVYNYSQETGFGSDTAVQLVSPEGAITNIPIANAAGSLSSPYWYVADLQQVPGVPGRLEVKVQNQLLDDCAMLPSACRTTAAQKGN